jgi:glycosyltransferase involved in cell wall biosynthesis/intein/homing endonuclease
VEGAKRRKGRVLPVTSERAVSLQRVALDIADVLREEGFSVMDPMLYPDAVKFTELARARQFQATYIVMAFDTIWAIPFFYLGYRAKADGMRYVWYATVEGRVRRTGHEDWVFRELEYVAVSRYVARKLGEAGARVRAIVHHGVDTQEAFVQAHLGPAVRRGLGLSEKDFAVGYLAGAYARKGHDLFAAVIKEVAQRDPTIKFFVVTAPQALENYAGAPNTQVLTNFGQKPREWVWGFYHALDLYAHPALAEGFGLPVLEAMACLPAGSKVFTESGLKNIEDVSVGERVLTHRGRLRRVTRTFRRWYSGYLVKITPYGSPSVYLTPEHPVLVEPWSGWRNFVPARRGYFRRPYAYNWKPAGEVRRGDIVVFPYIRTHPEYQAEPCKRGRRKYDLLRFDTGLETDGERVWYESGYSPKTGELCKYSRFIPWEGDLAFLMGLYIAEGSVNEGAVEFAFGGDEENLARKCAVLLKKYFGVEPLIDDRRGRGRNVIRVVASGRILRQFFTKTCGEGARNKRIPPEFLYGSKDVLRALVEGMWAGDGSLVGNRASYATRSYELALQLRAALIRLGLKPTLQINQRCSGTDCYVNYVVGNTRNRVHSNKSWLYRSGLGIEVKSVELVPFEGWVYNLEVEEDNSYVTEGFAVHNCGKPVVHADYDPLSEITTPETSFRVPVIDIRYADDPYHLKTGIDYEHHVYDPVEFAEAILQAKEEVLRRREELAQACFERAKEFDKRKTYKEIAAMLGG